MINSNRLKTALLLSGVCFTLVFLVSCSGNDSSSTASSGVVSHNGTDMRVAIAAPSDIAALAITGLSAEVTLNGTNTSPLDVNPATNAVSGTVYDVPVGTYDLEVTYFVTFKGVDVILCTYSTRVKVEAGKTTGVAIPDEDLDRNIDNDEDGYTNLAEVRLGTDPLSNLDFPKSGSPVIVAGNGSIQRASSASYTVKQIVGPTMAGSVSSTSYEVIVPFVEND